MPTTDESCCVPSPQSPVSGPVAGRAAKGMRFRVRTLHALVRCSLDGGETENWIVGGFLQCILQSPQSAEISVRAPFLRVSALLSLGHSLGAVPAPGGTARLCFTDCGALFFKNRKLVAPQSVPYGFRFPENLLCKERKKHFPDPPKKTPLGTWERGTLASLRARVSRRQSGQIQTGEKQWHSTYQLCGIGAVLLSAICREVPGRRAPAAADVTMSWLPTGGPGGALGRQITPWRRTE